MIIKWQCFSEDNLKNNPDLSGIYKIRIKNNPIDRLLGQDKQGILAIGKSNDLKKRLKQFYKGFTEGKSHSEGKTLHLIMKNNPKWGEEIIDKLEFTYTVTKTEEEAIKLEEKEIKTYFKKFGEVPPLNSAIPGKYQSSISISSDA